MFWIRSHLETKLDECDNENKQKPFDCVNTFIAEQAGCMAHSYGLNTSKEVQKCVTLEEYTQFIKTAFEVFAGKHSQTLQARKCLRARNCNDYTWSGHRAYGADFSRMLMTNSDVSNSSKHYPND